MAFLGCPLAVWGTDREPAILNRELKLTIPVINSDSSSCTLPFNRIGNLIVIKATVDSMEGNFILDTGAPCLVLNLTYFRDYPITQVSDEEQSSIAGRGTTLSRTQVKELSFGTLQFFRTDADLANLGNIENAKGIRVLGMLGVELFKQCEMVIDFEKNLIYLHRISKKAPRSCVQELLKDTSLYRTYPIQFINNRIVTESEIAGRKVRFIIDCAAESNILDSRLPNRVFELVTINRRVKLTGPGEQKIDALYGSLSQLKMGSRLIDDLPVIVLNLEYTCFAEGNCGDGVLGFDFLSRQKIGFNFVSRKMYLWK